MIKPKKVSMRHSIARLVPEPLDSLVEPDGDVHCQHLVFQGLYGHGLAAGV